MAEPIIFPVRPGSISAKDRAALSKAGVIVVEHENPSELRLLRPSGEIDGGALLRCALRALVTSDTYSNGNHQREQFTRLVAEALAPKHSSPQS